MDQKFNSTEKQAALNKILESKYFQESDVSTTLLIYLFDLAIKEIPTKEKTIALDLYNKKDIESSSDSYVRSNVYKLRKRLQNYYDNEGKNDRIRLIIPKGGYHVEFIEKLDYDFVNTKTNGSNKKLFYALGFLALLVILLFILIFANDKKIDSLKDHPFWSSIGDNSNPLCLAISNLEMYNEFDEELNRNRSILDLNAADKLNVEELIKNNPQRNLSPLKYSFVLMSNPENYFRLGQIYHDIENEIIYKLSSDITWNDITKNNLFFIGDIRSIYRLSSVLSGTHINVELPYTLTWVTEDTVKKYSFTPHKDSDWESYAAVVKVPGPNNNTIFLIIGTTYSARIHMMEKLTDLDFLNDLYQKLNSKFNRTPKYFELLYQTKGFQRVVHSSKLLYMEELHLNQFNWNE